MGRRLARIEWAGMALVPPGISFVALKHWVLGHPSLYVAALSPYPYTCHIKVPDSGGEALIRLSDASKYVSSRVRIDVQVKAGQARDE
jgi:hypothetical protein